MNAITFLNHFLTVIQDGPSHQTGFWAYPLIALLVAIEGPITILLASTAASAGALKPVPIFIAASIGNLSADLVWYSLGYYSKLDWLLNRTKWFGAKSGQFDYLKQRLQKNASKILFLAKLSNGLIVPSLITAGVIRVPLRRWLPFVAIGETIVTGALVAIGYFATINLFKFEKGMEYVFFGLTIFFMLIAMYFVQKTLRQKTRLDAAVIDTATINEKAIE